MRIGLPDGAASALPPIATESAATSAVIQRVATFMLSPPPCRSFGAALYSLGSPPRCGFVILDEVVGGRRAPHIERVFHRVVLRPPVDVRRYEVDVVRVLGEAAPGIARIVEVVRPENVPTDAPPVGVPALDHLLHPQSDVVEGGDIPARVVKAGSIRLGESEHVVVARMRPVQECDALTGAVG